MKYLRAWFINFLIVFFVNHMTPGIGVRQVVKLPHISSEVLFALGLGLLNSLWVCFSSVIGQGGWARVALGAFILNFSSYALLRFFPIDLHVETVEGYLLASFVTSMANILTYFTETKKKTVPKTQNEHPIEENCNELH